MNEFEKKSVSLRNEIINYIRDYVKKANRNIIVGKGNISYLQWDEAKVSENEDEIQIVPEVEITMIGLDSDGIVFYDVKGNKVYTGAFDTEELLYIVGYLESIEEELAPEADVQN